MPRFPKTKAKSLPAKVRADQKASKAKAYRRNSRLISSGANINVGGISLKGNNPFPPTYYANHKYSELQTLPSGAVSVFGGEQIYSLNDMFDPNFTGVGHQPYGRDTMVTIYGKYIVTAVTIDIMFTDPLVDGLGVGIKLDSTTDTVQLQGMTYDQAGEKFNVWTKALNNTGSQTVHFVKKVAIHKLLGISRQMYLGEQSRYGANSGASPADLLYVRLACQDLRGGGAGSVLAQCKLTYHCKWYSRITLAPS